MKRSMRTRIILAAATAGLTVALVPVGAHASGGYTLSCSGTSPGVPAPVPGSFVTCTRPGTPSDDDGAYAFNYNAPLACGGSGSFTVAAAGPEGPLLPFGLGSYVTTPPPGPPTMAVTFSYLVLENSTPPTIEQHNVKLTIDCLTGATTGTLSE